MADLEQHLTDDIADGRLTEDDAFAVRTFSLFLGELPPKGERFSTREAWEAWQARWHPYLKGEADGPIEP